MLALDLRHDQGSRGCQPRRLTQPKQVLFGFLGEVPLPVVFALRPGQTEISP